MKHAPLLALATVLACTSPLFAQNGQTLDVAAQFEVLGPEPSTSGSVFLNMGIAETLVNANLEGELTPGLATDWSVSEDNLTWRFDLRDGVVFHDGSAMDAEAVANALEIARNKPGLLASLPIDAFTADGPDTLVITLNEPLAALPAFLAEYRSQILAPAAYGPDGNAIDLIATGPYRMTDLSPPLALAAEAFPDYWGDQPPIQSVTYSAVSRTESRALMSESGDADFVFGLDPASVARLDMLDDVDVLSVAIPRTLMLKVNADHPFLDSPEARQALSLAIDRQGIAQAVLRYPEGADQLLPPSIGEWHNDDLAPLTYDVARAQELLADLGWTQGPAGILTRDGERFALELLTYPNRPELPLVAAVLEQQFRQIGVEITINSTNSSAIPSGHADGSLDLALFARNFALTPDPVGTIITDYAPNGEWGAMNWDNDEMVALVSDIARDGGDQNQRQRVTAILQEELPVIPIAWYRQTLSVSSDLEGAEIDPYERSFGLPDLRWAQ